MPPSGEFRANLLAHADLGMNDKGPLATRHQLVERTPFASAAAGLLLLDSSLRPVFLNAEAMKILAYPEKRGRLPENVLSERIRSLCPTPRFDSESPAVTEIKSGRRCYSCRRFAVSALPYKGPHPKTAVLLERSVASGDFLEMADGFQLTPRERETVGLLTQGLTSKQIASRMGISANTVKTFLRLVMVKTGVTTRSGIVGKLLHDANRKSARASPFGE